MKQLAFIFVILLLLFMPVSCWLFQSRSTFPSADYQFPQMGCSRIDLNGEWLFILDPNNIGEKQGFFRVNLPEASSNNRETSWQKLQVPGSWESQGINLHNPAYPAAGQPYDGVAWLRRVIPIPADWKDFDLYLNLGTLDDKGEVYFNEHLIGATKQYGERAEFKIPANVVKPGVDNVLVVKVIDTVGEGGITDGDLYIKPMVPWDKLEISVNSPDGTFIYLPNQPVVLKIQVKNPIAKSFDAVFHIYGRYFFNSEQGQSPKWHFSQKIPLKIKAEGSTECEIALSEIQELGHYDLLIELYHNQLLLKRVKKAVAVVPPPVKYKDVARSPFALCGGALFHIPLESHKTLGEIRLRQHILAGAYWGRNDLWWGSIENPKGNFDWAKADSTVALFEKYQINLLGILCYNSAWSNNTSPANDQDVEEFANYVENIIKRYKGRVRYWEVWNEPNIPPFWVPRANPRVYAKLLKRSYEVAHSVYPDVKIIGLVTSGVDLNFIEAVLKEGVGRYMDIISVHPYHGHPPTYWGEKTELGKLPRLKNLLDKYGLNIPIWITECGWETRGSINERIQAEYLIKFYVRVLASKLVERIYWFDLDDWGERDSPDEGQFGLIYCDQTPKPSFVAYRTMTGVLHDFTQINAIQTPAGIEGYRFTWEAEPKIAYVFWSNAGVQQLTSPEDAKFIVDIMGRKSALSQKSISVDSLPVFLVNE